MDATLSVQRVSTARTSFTPNLPHFRRQTSILVTDIPDKEIIEPHFGRGNEGWGRQKGYCLLFGALRALMLDRVENSPLAGRPAEPISRSVDHFRLHGFESTG